MFYLINLTYLANCSNPSDSLDYVFYLINLTYLANTKQEFKNLVLSVLLNKFNIPSKRWLYIDRFEKVFYLINLTYLANLKLGFNRYVTLKNSSIPFNSAIIFIPIILYTNHHQ